VIPLLFACAAAPPVARVLPPVPGDGPFDHVVLISIDTLRADHLGVYGGQLGLSPKLDRLARGGVVFRDATTPAPTTLAAHTSMLSGLWPHHHGVPRNGFVVPDEVVTLPERLGAAGWASGAFLGGYPLIARFGFTAGFTHVDDRLDDPWWDPFAPEVEQLQRRGDRVVDAALGWLDDGAPEGTHLFLFVHLFDPHAPYDPPSPWADATPRTVAGSLEERRRVREAWPDDSVTQLSAGLASRYAAEVGWTDAQVGRLLDGVRARLGERVLVMVVADHGEAFTEHDERWDHGTGVWQETVHVPWIVSGPGIAPGVVDGPVGTIDVAPTVLGLLELPPDPIFDGHDDSAAVAGGGLAERYVFAEATKPHKDGGDVWENLEKCRAVRRGSLKLVWCPNGGPPALFDLASDPGETKDLAGERPEVVRELVEVARAWSAGAAPGAPPLDDAATAAQLEALGYAE
jgi:arylsulfatase A-like enzyme